MTTITIEREDMDKKHFNDKSELLDYLLSSSDFEISIENWTEEEKELIENRPENTKEVEKEIDDMTFNMKW